MISKSVPYLGLEWQVDLLEGSQSDDAHIVVVKRVVANSPAARAGLQAGDVICGVDGGALSASSSLTRLIHMKKPGAAVALDIRRGDRRSHVKVTLGERQLPELRRPSLD